MTLQLEQSVIRILRNGETVSTGTIVTNNLAVTCAHVVEQAGSGPGQPLSIQFLVTERLQTAQVITEGWSPTQSDDIAFLQLDNLPSRVSPAVLGSAEGRMGHQYIALGFAEVGPYRAYWMHDMILGIVPLANSNAHPQLQLKGESIMAGMSGAPIFDIQAARVVGVIGAYGEFGVPRMAWATTSDTLASLNPQIRLWPDIYGPGEDSQLKEQERVQLVKLRHIFTTSFSESELRDLCFDFGVDYERLGGEGKGDKARELIAYFERRGRVAELLEVCQRLRSNVSF